MTVPARCDPGRPVRKKHRVALLFGLVLELGHPGHARDAMRGERIP
jgi:hypothetical protein